MYERCADRTAGARGSTGRRSPQRRSQRPLHNAIHKPLAGSANASLRALLDAWWTWRLRALDRALAAFLLSGTGVRCAGAAGASAWSSHQRGAWAVCLDLGATLPSRILASRYTEEEGAPGGCLAGHSCARA